MTRRTLCLAAAFSIMATAAHGLVGQGGSGGLGFTCNGQDGMCTCKGPMDGHDCKMMLDYCKSKTGSPNPQSGDHYCYYFKPSHSTGKTLHHPPLQKSPDAR
jgi:hypothetical protein